MNLNSILLNSYINNASDILYLSSCDSFNYYISKLSNKKTIIHYDKIHNVRSISSFEQFIYTIDNFITFFKSNFFVDPLECKYIIDLFLSQKDSIFLDNTYFHDNYEKFINGFKKVIANHYIENINVLKDSLPYLENHKDIESLKKVVNSNNKNIYVLFEEIKSNINYYVTLWDHLFSNTTF